MINDYKIEARSRWGNTEAYLEHEKKTKNYTKEKWSEANDGLMAIFAEFAACKENGASADSAKVQALVAKLQAHITDALLADEIVYLLVEYDNSVCEKFCDLDERVDFNDFVDD